MLIPNNWRNNCWKEHLLYCKSLTWHFSSRWLRIHRHQCLYSLMTLWWTDRLDRLYYLGRRCAKIIILVRDYYSIPPTLKVRYMSHTFVCQSRLGHTQVCLSHLSIPQSFESFSYEPFPPAMKVMAQMKMAYSVDWGILVYAAHNSSIHKYDSSISSWVCEKWNNTCNLFSVLHFAKASYLSLINWYIFWMLASE